MHADSRQREQAAMDAVTERLIKDFSGRRDDAEITHALNAAYKRYDGAPIREFVPVLVERYAREKLRTPI